MSYEPLKSYANTALEGRIAAADPHGLISILIEGAQEKITLAKAHMLHGNIPAKGLQIGLAISIIGGLRAGLDLEKGGEIAAGLDALYDYMERRLLQANLENEPQPLEEVAALLATIRSGWEAIPPEYRNPVRP